MISLKICFMKILVSSIAYGYSFKIESIIITQTLVKINMSVLNICQPRRTLADTIVASSHQVLSHESIIDFDPVPHENALHSNFKYNAYEKDFIHESRARHWS